MCDDLIPVFGWHIKYYMRKWQSSALTCVITHFVVLNIMVSIYTFVFML